MDLSFLPAVNATLNGAATVLLVTGRALIKQKYVTTHRRVMLSAFVVSCLFLVLYVVHKAWRRGMPTPFPGHGVWRALYYAILASHVLLAMTVPVLAIILIRRGLRGQYAAHRRLARLAWPVWLYVSITGVLIYFLLYHFPPTQN